MKAIICPKLKDLSEELLKEASDNNYLILAATMNDINFINNVVSSLELSMYQPILSAVFLDMNKHYEDDGVVKGFLIVGIEAFVELTLINKGLNITEVKTGG